MKRLFSVLGLVGAITLISPYLAAKPDPKKGDKGGSRSELRATLRGIEEVPSIVTQAEGQFHARISDDKTTIAYELMYEDFATDVLASHIHVGQRGVSGAVVAFLCGGGGKPTCPLRSGTVNGTITQADIITVPAQEITGTPAESFAKVIEAIGAGVAYVNVHSAAHPGGEIRGQIRAHHHGHDKE